MIHLRDALVELYRRVATSMPTDVVKALRNARAREQRGSRAVRALAIVLENIARSEKTRRPICQDTGVPIFFIDVPSGMHCGEIEDVVSDATKIATRDVPLRPNAVDVLTGENSRDNTGSGFPIVHFREKGEDTLVVTLMLKGSGSENIGRMYALPDEPLGAERSLDGVRRCIIDTVYRAQGRGCPPYVIGVGIGATRDQVARLSKEQLLRRIDDSHENPTLSAFEKRVLREVNVLGIGPIGLGGRTTAIGVKVGVNHRHPASYFVDVSISCWADRRARLVWDVRRSTYTILQ